MNRLELALTNPRLALRWLFKSGVNLVDIDLVDIEDHMIGWGAILEAGASDGVDTLKLARRFPRHEIFAFEPVREQFEHVQEQVQGLSNVHVFNLALSDTNEVAEIYVGRSGKGLEGMGSSSLLSPNLHIREFPEIEFRNKQQVKSRTLKSLVGECGINLIDLMWLDVQGYELKIIESSSEVVSQYVNLIHLEVSRVQLYDGMPLFPEVKKKLKALGFRSILTRVGRVSGNILFKNRRFGG